MGIFRATKHKTLFKLSAAIFVLSIAIFAILAPINVSAAGLSFSWKDSQTIAVSGTVTGNLLSLGDGSTQFQGSVKGSSLCNDLRVTVDSTNTNATLDSTPSGHSFGVAGTKSCYVETFNIPGPQSISGTRPTTAAVETASQKSVVLRLSSNLNKDKSPKTVKFTIKNSSGKIIDSPTVTKTVQKSDGIGSANSVYEVFYSYTTSLNPGN